MTDAQLLERFASRRDAAAFEELVPRHGPMVLRVCRRVLHQAQDAEDAFQATFIVLVRKAAAIARPELLANWLYGVAYRIALQMKAATQKHRPAQGESAQEPIAEPTPRPGIDDEVREVLDEELNRLPEKYRAPLVLCYLQGKSTEDAAAALGCPRGTVLSRLSRGRDRLQSRLSRRGVAVGGASLATVLTAGTASPSTVPPALASATTQAAMLVAAGKAAGAGVLSVKAAALADGALKAMAAVKLKIAAAALAAVTVVAAVAGTTAYLNGQAEPARMVWLTFDGPTLTRTNSGEELPNAYYKPTELDPGGLFTTAIDTSDAVAGNSLRMVLTRGRIKARFMPQDREGELQFAREYAARPESWRFNTYNRFRFWFQSPTTASQHKTDGGCNAFLLASTQAVKKSKRAPTEEDRTWFHHLNIPATGCWTQVIITMHPHNIPGQDMGRELGNQPHPTGEPDYNFFDTLTSLYLECRQPPERYPATYRLDEIEFYQERAPENDEQIYGLTATHVPSANRIIVTWNRPKGEDHVRHELRYAFRSVHQLGWEHATPAPAGAIAPSGRREENGMVFDSTGLPLTGQKTVHIAIKPENAQRFSEVAIPLTLK